jgi:hypothetical protein
VLRLGLSGRRLAFCSLLVGVIGLALGALGSLAGQFDLLLLVQSWRWPWLGRFVAVVLLPAILVSLWRDGGIGRGSSILLACAWVLAAYSGGLIALGAAALWFSRRHLDAALAPRILVGACVLVAAAALVMVSVALQVLTLDFDTNRAPVWVQRFTDLAGLNGPPVLAIAAAWYFTLAKRSSLGTATVAVLAAIALWGQLPFAYARLTDERYSTEAQARFANWRDIIPPSAEVFWHEEPAAAWALLSRKSFLSVSQSAGLMYSADAIPEFRRRSETLSSMVTTDWWTRGREHDDDVFPATLSMPILHDICRDRTLGFVVSGAQLEGYASKAEWPIRGQNVFLYDCAAFRDRPRS